MTQERNSKFLKKCIDNGENINFEFEKGFSEDSEEFSEEFSELTWPPHAIQKMGAHKRPLFKINLILLFFYSAGFNSDQGKPLKIKENRRK